MEYIRLLLSPVVWAMNSAYEVYYFASGSAGFSILLLSATFSILFLLVRNRAVKLEDSIGLRAKNVAFEINALPGCLKGESRFKKIEKIYSDNNYHPIQNVGMAASFFVMLPVLLAAFYFLTTTEIIIGKSFYFIDDLSAPDQYLSPINILPLIITLVNVLDSRIRFSDNPIARHRFYLVALLMLFILHDLPAALLVYWTGNSLMSLSIGLGKYGCTSLKSCV